MAVGQAEGEAGVVLLALGVAALAIGAGWFAACMRATRFRYPVSFWWMVVWLYCRLVFRLRRVGPCAVPAEGPVLVVANHTCGADPLLLVACIPSRVPAFLVAEEFSNPPVFGRIVRMIDCIPVRRDGRDTGPTRGALRHLKAGKLLAIFIQGRIPRPGEAAEARDGATVLALHSRAIVVPAHISGTIWTESLLSSFFMPHKAQVRFGEPIDLRAYAGPHPDKEAVARLSAMLMERIRRLGAEQRGRAMPVARAGAD
jgi:1-acyl-sn-glycerol-3-phosphate acyltransferase